MKIRASFLFFGRLQKISNQNRSIIAVQKFTPRLGGNVCKSVGKFSVVEQFPTFSLLAPKRLVV